MRQLLKPFVLLFCLGGMIIASSPRLQAQAGGYSGGAFALGIRSTANKFLDDHVNLGIGAGGQFKFGISDRVNTEWFADYINSSIGDYGFRRDYHIGWSVQFAMNKEGFGRVGKITPYILGGQCFDLTTVGIRTKENVGPIFSAAAQIGAGGSWFVTEPFEITLQAQYMMHISKDVHIEGSGDTWWTDPPEVHVENGANFLGHLLFTLSANYYFLDFSK